MEKGKKITILAIILTFILSPSISSNRFVFSEEEDLVDPIDVLFENSNYAEITTNTEINHYLEIPANATLMVRKGVKLTFNGGSMGVYGKIILKGTVRKPVIVKNADGAPSYSISTRGNYGSIEMMNADVSGGGSNDAPPVFTEKKSIWNTAQAFGPEGVINVWRGQLIAEGCSFHDNAIAVSLGQYNSGTKVNRSKFFGNSAYDVLAGGSNQFNFQYNWWGSENGPNQEKISGEINTSNWARKENFHDPVILTPGVLGSQKEGDEWKMDPIFHTYEGLQKTFEESGYTLGKDLFVFPYEWRDSNVDNALKLRDKINEIKAVASWPKVDIVAHSMGGILARVYIESDYYSQNQNDVDQLVTLGTPQKGSPEDYLTWESGELGVNKEAFVLEEIFKQEAKENKYSSIFEYVKKRPIASAQELLPNYNYLFSVSGGAMRTYPNFYPANSFLDGLNSSANLSKLEKIEFTNIYGNLDDEKSTVTSIRVGEPSSDLDSIWGYGKPENYDSMTGNHGLVKGKGDGTVPVESATGISSDEIIEKKIAHRDLPNDASGSAYEAITGFPPTHRVDYPGSDKIMLIFVFSPVDIQVVDENGNWAGKNIGNLESSKKIIGAYYSGFETNSEFVTIPDPGDGKYKILMQGTDNDAYRIETSIISENVITNETQESSAEIAGTAVAGQLEEKYVTLENNIITADGMDLIPPEISIAFPENNKNYLNNQIIEIKFSATDNKTASDKIATEFFLDGNKLEKNSIDLAVQNLGKHLVKITASDEAGNYSQSEVNFNNTADIDSIISNVSHYSDLGLIGKTAEKKQLLAQLSVLEMNLNLLYEIRNNKKLNIKARSTLVKAVSGVINLHIDLMSGQLRSKNGFISIDQKVKTLLIESINSLKII
jgi:hypothetical protein